MDEFELIRLLTGGRKPGSGGNGTVVGIGDDAAVVEHREGFQWVVTCDTMVQEIHFKETTMSYRDVGYKAMASNVSDLAAMGALPRFALALLCVPKGMEPENLKELYDGMYQCADRFGVTLIGGDTVSTPGGLVLGVTAIGEVERGKALLRSRARPGDEVFLTGPVGLSAAGLTAIFRGDTEENADVAVSRNALQRWVNAHRRPEPQVLAGRLLVESGYGRALNDISDGLASEAWEIAEASRCTLVLREQALPVDPELDVYAAATGNSLLDWMLAGGEDYQLIGTVAGEDADKAEQLFASHGLAFYRIGRVEPGTDTGAAVWLVKPDGRRVPVGKVGYNHFKR